MANKNRGEVSINLGSNTYIMRPTFQALCSIESEIGKSIVDLLLNLAENKPKLSEIQAIIKHGIRAYEPNNLSDQDIGNLIMQAGVINIMPAIIEFLELSLGITYTS